MRQKAADVLDTLPNPPNDEAEALHWLRLIRSPRVGPVSFRKLLAKFGSAREALEALPEHARSTGDPDYSVASLRSVETEYRTGVKARARLLAIGEDDYPQALSTLHDAPPLIWAIGDVELAKKPAIGLVGARNASALGQRTARALAIGLGKAGHVIVSGLARGIDSAAHSASLDTGTIAVFAGGVDVHYPSENSQLGEAIQKTGLCISEAPMGLHPHARHFPRRNRLISGLACGLVVVEAATKSGSLITARDALDQGREVMAVPAHPFDSRAGGCNQLIRDGATLVRNAEDVLRALSSLAEAPTEPAKKEIAHIDDTGDLRTAILSLLTSAPVDEYVLGELVTARPEQIAQNVTELELEGSVLRHPGGRISRVA